MNDMIDEDDEEQATYLMIHHLNLACRLFENTHDDGGARAYALIRIMMPEGWDHAARSFVDHMVLYYRGLGTDIDGADNDNAQDDNEEGA